MKFGQVYPGADKVPQIQMADRRLKIDLAQLQIPYFDLDEQFAAKGISADQILRGNDDGHWNAEGHRLVAEYLYDFLSGIDLLNLK